MSGITYDQDRRHLRQNGLGMTVACPHPRGGRGWLRGTVAVATAIALWPVSGTAQLAAPLLPGGVSKEYKPAPGALAAAAQKPATDDKTPVVMSDLWGSQKASSANPIGEHGAWFSQDKYALFIHWGLFSHTEGKWDGQNYFGIVEWLMHPAMANIPPEKYHAISQKFKPDSFNAQAWVDFAKRIGVKTIVITAKHHDGFAMYKSKADSFNVVDATPFKRDPIEELSETCAKAGIRFGFYYSQYQDWREQGGANIDWSDPKQKNSFDAYFKRKALPQVRELLTNYGDIAIAWFDTPGPMDKGYSAQLVDLVRKLQPKALINSRIGNDLGDYATLGDNQVPRVKHGGLWETVDTTNNSWGYTALDSSWKTPSELARRLISTVARGGSYMINMGPHADGTFPEIPDLSLRKVGAWLQRHGESIYGAQASPWSSAQPWGDVTVGKRGLYLHIFDWPDDASRSISLYGIGGKVRAAKLLDDDMPLSVASENGWTTVTLPERKPDSIVPVILLEMEGDYTARNAIGVNPNFASTLIAERAKCTGCSIEDVAWMEHFGEWKSAPSATNWKAGSRAMWTVVVKQPGFYKAFIDYSVNVDGDVTQWELSSQKASQPFEAIYTGARDNVERSPRRKFWGDGDPRFREQDIGTIQLFSGQQVVTIRPMMGDERSSKVKVTALRLVRFDIGGDGASN